MVITEASKLSNFSCSSSKVIGMSLAWTARVSSLYSLPRPSSILLVRSSASSGAPRRSSSSTFAFMDCRNVVLAFGLFDAATRRLGLGGGQDSPCFAGYLGLCNEWYDGVGDGANDCIQD